MRIDLKNFSIETNGAELLSMTNNAGKNLLWSKQTDHWNRIAPHLFPFVGKLVNNQYVVQGKTYTVGQHGFARDRAFEVIFQSENEAVLELQSDRSTMEVYPYTFLFQVRYRWMDEALHITYSTFNRGEKNMYYAVGGHPAFLLDEPLENYYLEFDTAIQLERQELKGSYFSGEATYYGVSSLLPLNNELFENDAFVLHHPGCKTVHLKKNSGENMVTLSCENWSALGIWTKKDAPFICIEPWWGWADDIGTSGIIEDKAGMRILAPGHSESLSYVIGS